MEAAERDLALEAENDAAPPQSQNDRSAEASSIANVGDVGAGGSDSYAASASDANVAGGRRGGTSPERRERTGKPGR